jgi:hypothetical protein
MTPDWILDILAAVMLVVAAVSAWRLAAAPRWRHGDSGTDIDIVHLLMGIAMAGMLVGGLQTLPDGAWEAVFAVTTVWFGWRVVRDARVSGARALARGHCAPHLLHCGAMLYMFAALPAGGVAAMGSSGMAAMGSGASAALEYPTLAFVFALVLSAYSVSDIDQLSGRRYSLAVVAPAGGVSAGASTVTAAVAGTASSSREMVLSPAVTVGCRIAMGVVMVFMLIIMI